jgi:hypothetical protein
VRQECDVVIRDAGTSPLIWRPSERTGVISRGQSEGNWRLVRRRSGGAQRAKAAVIEAIAEGEPSSGACKQA